MSVRLFWRGSLQTLVMQCDGEGGGSSSQLSPSECDAVAAAVIAKCVVQQHEQPCNHAKRSADGCCRYNSLPRNGKPAQGEWTVLAGAAAAASRAAASPSCDHVPSITSPPPFHCRHRCCSRPPPHAHHSRLELLHWHKVHRAMQAAGERQRERERALGAGRHHDSCDGGCFAAGLVRVLRLSHALSGLRLAAARFARGSDRKAEYAFGNTA